MVHLVHMVHAWDCAVHGVRPWRWQIWRQGSPSLQQASRRHFRDVGLREGRSAAAAILRVEKQASTAAFTIVALCVLMLCAPEELSEFLRYSEVPQPQKRQRCAPQTKCLQLHAPCPAVQASHIARVAGRGRAGQGRASSP